MAESTGMPLESRVLALPELPICRMAPLPAATSECQRKSSDYKSQ